MVLSHGRVDQWLISLCWWAGGCPPVQSMAARSKVWLVDENETGSPLSVYIC
jgi:hypothetical protein